MTKIIFKAAVLMAVVALCFTACKKDIPADTTGINAEQADNLRLIGLDPTQATLGRNGYIQIKDILIDPAGLEALVTRFNAQTDSALRLEDRQRSVANFMAIPYQQTGNIRYLISPDFTEFERNAILDGIKQWENTSNNLHFVEDKENPQILIIDADLEKGQYGNALWPMGDGPGKAISLDISAIQKDCGGDTATCIRNVVTHEMGHCLGMGHNDEEIDHYPNWFLGSPGPIGIDSASIMNSGTAYQGLVDLKKLSGPNDNDRKVISAMYPAAGITVPISGVFAEWVDENRYNFRLKYSQSGLNRSYTAYVQILQDGVVKKTKFVDIGIKSGGEIGFGIINLHPGLCQVKIFGINFRGDFTQSAYSTSTIMLE